MKKIYLSSKRLVLLALSFMFLGYLQAQIVVTGTVLDGKFGGGLPGANVIVKGTTVGTSTDIDGKFSIKVPDKSAVLVFSSIGYASQEVKVGDRTVIDITMNEDVKKIDEVVKVGYGVQKKSDVTGAVTQMSGEDLADRPVVGVDQAMQGKASGVQVTSNSSSPGGNAMVRIRGTGTINNADPLYVVDGVPQDTKAPKINPSEIKSISVLKDASSCAIYGSRAANGVIIITTKEGKMGKKSKDCENTGSSEISFDTYYGVQKAWNLVDIADASEYMKIRRANGVPMLGSVPSYVDTVNGTDWQDEIFRQAIIQRYTLSYETGSENQSFRLSSSYLNQEGIVKGSGYKAFDIGMKGNHRLKPKLSVSESIGVGVSTRSLIPQGDFYGNVITQALVADPTIPVTHESFVSDTNKLGFVNGVYNDIGNPARALDVNDQKYKNVGVGGYINLDYNPFSFASFKSSFAPSVYKGQYVKYTPIFYQKPDWRSIQREYQQDLNEGYNYTWSNTLTLSEDFMSKSDSTKVNHSVSLMLGNEIYYNFNNKENYKGYRLSSLAENYRHMSSADSLTISKDYSPSENSLVSLLGRLNYAFRNKYLLTTNIRYDWSSRFIKGNRLGIFPSFSLGWKVNEEDFFKNNESLKFINELKVRVGWGQIGNQFIGDYDWSSGMFLERRGYSFGGKQVDGATTAKVPNPALQWETTQQTNLGLDLNLYKNSVVFSLDFFKKSTKGMLIDQTMPMITGAEKGGMYEGRPTQTINAGNVENKGFETSLSYRKSLTKQFNFDIGGNFTYVKNEVVNLGDSGTFFDSKPHSGPAGSQKPCRTVVGQPIASFYGLKTDGIYNSWEEVNNGPKMNSNVQPGDYKYVDVNGDGVINTDDMVFIGSPLPKFTYGFYLSGNYSFIDFNLAFQASYGNQIYNMTRAYIDANGMYNYSTRRLNAWTESNHTSEPRQSIGTNNYDMQSDAYIENGSYLRLKDVTIGFTLPKTLADKIKVNRLRVYVQGSNVLTFTKYSGYDPEIGKTDENETKNVELGVDNGTYPQARTFLIGLNFSF